MNIGDLEKLGLEKKAARAYLACLEIGSGTALQIGKKIGVPKSTVHDIMNGLVSKGLASTYLKKSRKFYSISNPEIIGEKVSQQMRTFERILPELQALAYKGVGKTKVRYYDTKVGIEAAVKEMFAEAKELIFFGNVSAAFEAYPEYFPGYIKGRVKHGITSRGIVTPGPITEEFMKNDKESIRKTHVIKTNVNVTSFLWVWNDKVVIFNTIGDHSVIIIEDPRIAKLVEGMFEFMWEVVQSSE